MPWRLEWTAAAVRDLRALETALQQRIRGKLRESLADPLHYFSKLAGQPVWRLRVGDRRVLVLIAFREETIEVQAILHRSVAYR